MKKILQLVLVAAMLSAAALLGACASDQEVSAGQTDQVSGFLFVSDIRPSTIALVDAMAAREVPVRATYDFGTEVTFTDPQQIRALYTEMSGLILIGLSTRPDEPKGYYVEFELADGTVSRFDFSERTQLNIGDQYYMLESGSDFYRFIGA